MAGTVRQLPGRFYPAAIPNHVISMAVLTGLMYLLPGLFLMYSALVAWYSRAPWLARISEDLSGHWGKQAIGMVILTVIVAGLVWMLRMSWLAWLRFTTWRSISQRTLDNDHLGLLLDDQFLVFCHGEHFDEHQAGWLPKNSITNCRVKTVRHWFPKRSFQVTVTCLQYQHGGQQQELIIPERFGLTAHKMADEIERWLQSN